MGSVTNIRYGPTSPALFKILATLGVLAWLSTTPVLVVEIKVLVSTPTIVRRIGRIRGREVAIGYRLFWAQFCAIVAGDAAVGPVFDYLQL